MGAEVVEPARAVRALSTLKRGDLVVAFPERWMWLERTIRRWPDGVSGVTSTAPCPRALIEALMDQGLAAMTEVYGSSETAGVATRAWPEAGYRLMPHWVFEGGHDAAVTRVVDGSGRRFELPDAVQRAADGCFTIIGRRDDAVQVGGVNVRPDDVAAALRGRPGVSDVAVRLMRPDEGLRLKAFIVADVGWNEDDLRSQLGRLDGTGAGTGGPRVRADVRAAAADQRPREVRRLVAGRPPSTVPIVETPFRTPDAGRPRAFVEPNQTVGIVIPPMGNIPVGGERDPTSAPARRADVVEEAASLVDRSFPQSCLRL